MDVPAKLVYGFVGALLGTLGTLGAAVLRYLNGQDQTEAQRARMQAEIEDRLRDDLLEAYTTERDQHIAERDRRCKAEAQAAEYKSEVGELRDQVDKMIGELDDVEERLDRAEAHAEWCEQRLLRVDACLEEDSDVDWGVDDV